MKKLGSTTPGRPSQHNYYSHSSSSSESEDESQHKRIKKKPKNFDLRNESKYSKDKKQVAKLLAAQKPVLPIEWTPGTKTGKREKSSFNETLFEFPYIPHQVKQNKRVAIQKKQTKKSSSEESSSGEKVAVEVEVHSNDGHRKKPVGKAAAVSLEGKKCSDGTLQRPCTNEVAKMPEGNTLMQPVIRLPRMKENCVVSKSNADVNRSIKSFPIARTFQRELCSRADEEKPFSCVICHKSFFRQDYLEKHTVIHSFKKPFSCSVCGHSFTRQAHLNDHTMTHGNERPFSCSVCGRSFPIKGYLRRHAIVHSNDKPFKCAVCPQSFKRKYSLKRHFFTCHVKKYLSYLIYKPLS